KYAKNLTIEQAQDGSHNKPFVCIVRAAAEIVIAEWPKTASPPSTKSREETDEGETQQSDGHSHHEYTLPIAPYVANRIFGSRRRRWRGRRCTTHSGPVIPASSRRARLLPCGLYCDNGDHIASVCCLLGTW